MIVQKIGDYYVSESPEVIRAHVTLDDGVTPVDLTTATSAGCNYQINAGTPVVLTSVIVAPGTDGIIDTTVVTGFPKPGIIEGEVFYVMPGSKTRVAVPFAGKILRGHGVGGRVTP